MTNMIKRILSNSATPDLIESLTDNFSATDLQTLLMEVYRRRAGKVKPSDVYRQFLENRFVKPSLIEGKKYTTFDDLAFRLLPEGFKTMELSPVAPFGCCSVIAPVNQNNIVTTIRNTEVCSDSTNVLALECVQRRRQDPNKIVKLCSSFRVLRAQYFSEPAAFAHFRLLSLCTSGRDTGNFGFEIESVTEHVQYYLDLIEYAKKQGYQTGKIQVVLSSFDKSLMPVVEQKILKSLAEKNSLINFNLDPKRTEADGYYKSVVFRIYIGDSSGANHLIVDGGMTDWTQQLLSSRKERLLTSGFGSERFIFCFG